MYEYSVCGKPFILTYCMNDRLVIEWLNSGTLSTEQRG